MSANTQLPNGAESMLVTITNTMVAIQQTLQELKRSQNLLLELLIKQKSV